MTNFLMFIATAVIALYAYKNHELVKQIRKESDREKEKYHTLITSLIASNMVGKGKHNYTKEQILGQFKTYRENLEKIFGS